MPYYSLYIPSASGGASSTAAAGSAASSNGLANESNAAKSPYVFSAKCEALEVLKLHKDARLREFSGEDDAIKYAQTGYEVVQTKYADLKTPTAGLEKAAFRAPTKQELTEFRKWIEADDYERVKAIIWDNPRYLVSSGDTPTTLKEGYRYNAMHVCSISKKPRMAELILQTVSDVNFAGLLTGKPNDEKMCKELCVNLLDYYLNIPEKGRSETPLHLAAKTGCVEMVEVLTSYPECRMTLNKEGRLAKEIICTRNLQAAPELIRKIENQLEERFYVPVLRSMDSSLPPHIGHPFSGSKPPNLNSDPLSPEVKIQALAGPMNMDQANKFRRRWKTPPRMGSHTLPPIDNNPFISPMKSRGPATPTRSPATHTPIGTPIMAAAAPRALFQSTPVRAVKPNELNGVVDVTAAVTNDTDALIADKQNGNHDADVGSFNAREQVEANNNHETASISEMTLDMRTPMLKRAAFNTYRDACMPSPIDMQALITNHGGYSSPAATCDTPVNNGSGAQPAKIIRTPSLVCPNTPVLRLKKDVFRTYRDHCAPSPVDVAALSGTGDTSLLQSDSPGFKERHIKLSDTEKGLEVIGRELAKEQCVEWREYWDFIDAFIDIAAPSGLQQLETYFAQRAREMDPIAAKQVTANQDVNLADVCSVLERFVFGGDTASQTATRNGCNGERNRFANKTANSADGAGTAQSTTPYTCVEKSLQVFAKRITKTIVHNIDNVVSINDTLLSELKRLKSLICSFKEDARFLDVNFAKVHSRIGNLVSSNLESSQELQQPSIKSRIQLIVQNLLVVPGERREHLECVCARIHQTLNQPTEQILPEHLKTEVMCAKVWLSEKECDCQWETNLSRKTSRRNRYKSIQQQAKQQEIEAQQEALKKDEWRTPANDLDDDDVFWSDFGDTDDTEDEEEDIWYTPSESPSHFSPTNSIADETTDNSYKLYIFGEEPTKRDLDVLNAIFHVELDKQKYPNVHAWRATLLRYPNEEMDYFPSPSVLKKTYPLSAKREQPRTPRTPPLHRRVVVSQLRGTPVTPPSALHHSPSRRAVETPIAAKRLFITTAEVREKMPAGVSVNSQTPAAGQPQPHQSILNNPLHKLRGFFSPRSSGSPASASPGASSYMDGGSISSEASNNLSLFNVSAME